MTRLLFTTAAVIGLAGAAQASPGDPQAGAWVRPVADSVLTQGEVVDRWGRCWRREWWEDHFDHRVVRCWIRDRIDD